MSKLKVVVMGDIHGRFDALDAMLRHSGALGRSGRWVDPGFTLVQLGDLLDRGPQSRECLECMMGLQEQAGDGVVVLKGNHEDLLLKSWASALGQAAWLMNGAQATLQSYGADFQELCQPGGRHYQWMAGLPVQWAACGVLFVHGGLSRRNVKAMRPEGLMWDRPPLTRGPFQALVCGHTPTPSGTIETRDGIFFCDIGLGHFSEKRLEYLTLDLDSGGVAAWKVVAVD